MGYYEELPDIDIDAHIEDMSCFKNVVLVDVRTAVKESHILPRCRFAEEENTTAKNEKKTAMCISRKPSGYCSLPQWYSR